MGRILNVIACTVLVVSSAINTVLWMFNPFLALVLVGIIIGSMYIADRLSFQIMLNNLRK